MTTTLSAHGGGAQPARIDTSGKITGGAAMRVYGFDSEAAALAAGYVCEGGPAMSVALITDAQIASGAWKLDGDPFAVVIYTAPDNIPSEGGFAVPVYAVNGWGSAPAPSGPLFSSAEIGVVNAFTLPVTFSDSVSASDYAAGVTIKVNGTATTITSATRQADHTIVYYVIPVLWHGSGDTVTWEYSEASGNIVAESGGASLGDVVAQTVTNNIAWSSILDLQADTGVILESDPFAGTGTITQSGTTVTGDSTLLQREVAVGDTITGSSISGIVQSIASDTSLELNTSATVASGEAFTIARALDHVVQWQDQSGNNRHFSQSAILERPSYQVEEVSNAVYFDPTAYEYWQRQWMLGANFGNNLSNFMALVAYKFNADINYAYIALSKVDDIFTSAGFQLYLEYVDGINLAESVGNNFQTQVQGAGAGDLPVDHFYIYTGRINSFNDGRSYFNGTNSSPYEENNVSTGTVTSTSNSEPMRLGGTGDDVTQYSTFSGWLKGVMLFVPAPSLGEQAALEARLATRYGITL